MALEVDLELVKKYNKPGPRYTSYPTAPHFTDAVNWDDVDKEIRANNVTADRDLSLYFHIPFCDTMCHFCGCTTIVTRNREKIENYLTYLSKEIDLLKEYIHPDRKVVQLHFGGGTPTHLTPDQIRRLGDKINQSFQYAADAELGCEMDPRELTLDHIVALKEIGVNRASIGVQDFDPKVQEAINRINSKEMILKILEWVREENYQSINLDLIYGLPFQTEANFRKTLDAIVDMNPDRLAVFNYAHVPWMRPHQKKISENDLPSAEEKLSILKMIIETLNSAGYVYIGMDHFAKENDELTIAQREKTMQRNFQGYSTKGGADIYAFGMSSISQLENVYIQNCKTLKPYYEKLDADKLPWEQGLMLNQEDRIRSTVIMRLMCDLELDYKETSKLIGTDFQQKFADELSRMDQFVADGLLVFDDGKLRITEQGRLFIRNIAMTFDAYLENGVGRYSKTV